MYEPVRRDFAFGKKCSRISDDGRQCTRSLTSNVAIYLRNENGDEFPFGPDCVLKELDQQGPEYRKLLKKIPDFTKSVFTESPQTSIKNETAKEGRSSSGNVVSTEEREYQKALAYLILREEKLVHMPRLRYEPLSIRHKEYQNSRSLSSDAVSHIINLERKCGGRRYSFDHLQCLYAFDQCLTWALSKTDQGKRDFLSKMQERLCSNLRLSKEEVTGANKWFKKIDPSLSLDSSGFEWDNKERAS